MTQNEWSTTPRIQSGSVTIIQSKTNCRTRQRQVQEQIFDYSHLPNGTFLTYTSTRVSRWAVILSQGGWSRQESNWCFVERHISTGWFTWYGRPEFSFQVFPTAGPERLHQVDEIAALQEIEPQGGEHWGHHALAHCNWRLKGTCMVGNCQEYRHWRTAGNFVYRRMHEQDIPSRSQNSTLELENSGDYFSKDVS